MRSPVSQKPCTATARIAVPPPIRSQTDEDVSCASRVRNSRMNATAAITAGSGQQDAAFGEQVKILVVGLVDEDGPVGLLVHEHGRLVAAETGAREPEIANHAKVSCQMRGRPPAPTASVSSTRESSGCRLT